MAYTPNTWATGDTITATKLNNIESGVQEVSGSYTPNTWATGDTITAAKLNNIEQGIANAGMPTAHVSLSITDTNELTSVGFRGVTYDEQLGADVLLAMVKNGTHWVYELWYEDVTMSTDIEFTMLNEHFYITVNHANVVVTGNATTAYYEDDDQYVVTVTGDCTITVA